MKNHTAPVEHTAAFLRRRFFNWFPMGLTYALLYMGRYNLTVSKTALGDLMTKEDFGIIFGTGTVVYAFAFLLNGPLVDRIGGRKGILIAALGAGIMNLTMGLYLAGVIGGDAAAAAGERIRLVFTLLYAGNMYFQSYGAVSIVKVNAHWFHVRERGGFSGIFGTMISSGIFLAFTVNGWILDAAAGGGSEAAAAKWVFFAPAALLGLFCLIEAFLLRDSPSKAGFEDFDTGDASSGEEGIEIPVLRIMKRVVTDPIILTVALIEFCTGVLRNGVMHWFPIYAKEVWVLPGEHWLRYGSWGDARIVAGLFAVAAVSFWLGARAKGQRKGWLFIAGALLFLVPFMQGGWGGLLFVAGVIGANVAGWVSDLFFGSRRAPVAGILYALLAAASIGMFFTLGGTGNRVGWAAPPRGPFEAGDRVAAVAGEPVGTWAGVEAVLEGIAGRERGAARSVRGEAAPAGGAEAAPAGKRGGGETRSVTVAVVVERRGGEREGSAAPAAAGAGNTGGAAERAAGRVEVEVEVPLKEGRPAPWGLLPKNGLRAADTSAPPVIMALEKGDAILGVAGSADELHELLARGKFTTWEDVSSAVAAVPAAGIGGARWNPETRMCTYDGPGIPAGEKASSGVLFALIERGGRRIEAILRDPAPAMRAGEKRVLAAGPVLTLDPLWLGLIIFVMSICVIGTHGLLSGTATMDFGGRKGAATAVGMIDGFVYLGTGLQSFALGYLTTRNWVLWPVFLFPFGLIGFVLLRRIWYAIPGGRKGGR